MVYPQRVDQVNLYPCSSFKRRVYPDVKRNVLIRAGTTSPWSRNCLDSSRGLCLFSTSHWQLYSSITFLSGCHYLQTDLPHSYNYESRSQVPSATDCRQWCSEDSRCSAWVWTTATFCYKKSSLSDFTCTCSHCTTGLPTCGINCLKCVPYSRLSFRV